MNITICGDYFVSSGKSIPTISKRISSIFENSDMVFVNYEGPIHTNNSVKSIKTGPNLCQNEKTLKFLKENGVNGLVLSNNHFYDYGKDGVNNTINQVLSNNLEFIGCKVNKKNKISIVNKDNLKIGILAYAEEEWCGDSEDKYSISLIDDIDISNDIKEAKAYCDGVVIILHGNNEYNNLPSPNLQKKCRFYIEQGASTILVHHAHVISGYEVWNNYPIFYGLGNFQFTLESKKLDWYEGLIVTLNFEKIQDSLSVNFTLLPTVMDELTYNVKLAEDEVYKQIMNQIESLNLIIRSEKSLQKHYEQFVESQRGMYYEMFNPYFNRNILYRLIGRFVFAKIMLKSDFKKMYFNTLKCESHRNAMREILKKAIFYK
ncbi:CapA family protein [Acinetobacter indicus]|uniref:CapA family protein n=1 Tax=Acinetobacter indicus TaxID=756892 RepID=UPI0034D7B053